MWVIPKSLWQKLIYIITLLSKCTEIMRISNQKLIVLSFYDWELLLYPNIYPLAENVELCWDHRHPAAMILTVNTS